MTGGTGAGHPVPGAEQGTRGAGGSARLCGTMVPPAQRTEWVPVCAELLRQHRFALKQPPPPSPCVPARTKGPPSSLPILHPAPLGTPVPTAMLGGVMTAAPSPLSEPDFPGDLTPPAPPAVTGGPGRSCRGGWRMARHCLHPSWQLRGAAALRRTLSPGKSPARELPPHGCDRTGPWAPGPLSLGVAPGHPWGEQSHGTPAACPHPWQEGWEGASTRELIPKRQAAMPSLMLSLMLSLMPSSMPSLQGSAAG